MLWGTASLETAKASVNRNARRKSVSNERGGKNSGGRQVSMVQVDDIMNVFLVHWEQEDQMKTVKLKKLFQEYDADGNGTLELEEFKGLMKAVETAFLQSGNGSSASFNEFDIDGDGSMDDSELVTLYLDIMDEALGKPITDEVFARIAKEKLYVRLSSFSNNVYCSAHPCQSATST
jgi:Ca2+-binding EF-hand superfamily protein